MNGIQRDTNCKEVKVSLFADDMTVYINDPKDSARELLQLTNTFIKVARFKKLILKNQ